MKLFLLIPALVSGFIYCHVYDREYYKLHRYQGTYLNLRSTVFGFSFLLVESLTFLILHKHVPDQISLLCITIPLPITSYLEALLNPVFKTDTIEAVFVLQASILSPFLSYLFAKFLNRRMKKGYGRSLKLFYSFESHTGYIDELIATALIDRSSLLFTLSSGKVYVGDIIVTPPLPNESEKQSEEISIAPLMSGFRTDKKHKVKFNTDYDISILPDNVQPEELTVIFNKKDLISVSNFDIELYKHLNKKTNK
jgi:hypothetical protein